MSKSLCRLPIPLIALHVIGSLSFVIADESFLSSYSKQTEDQRLLSQNITKAKMREGYLRSPHAFVFHYAATKRPQKIVQIQQVFRQYRKENRLNAVVENFSPSVKIGFKKLLQADIGLGIDLKELFRSDQGFLGSADVLKARQLLEANPKFLDTAIDAIYESRFAQRKFEGPTFTAPGTDTPSNFEYEVFEEVADHFSIAADVQGLDDHYRNFTELWTQHLPGTPCPTKESYLEAERKKLSPEAQAERDLLTRTEMAEFSAKLASDFKRELLKTARLQSLPVEDELVQHQKRMKEYSKRVANVTHILSLVDPDMASDVGNGFNAALMIADGIEQIKFNELVDLSSVGSIAGGIKLAMDVLGPKRPTPEEVILKGLRNIVELQVKTLAAILELEKRLVCVQQDVEFLKSLSALSFAELRASSSQIEQLVKSLDRKISFLTQSTHQLAIDEIIRDTNTTNDVYEAIFTDPHSPFLVGEPLRESELYRELWVHLQRITSYATNSQTINSRTYQVHQSFADQTPIELETSLNCPPELRVGLLSDVVSWLNTQFAIHQVSNADPLVETNFRGLCHPGLFSKVWLPTFYDAAKWHHSPQTLSNAVAKLQQQFDRIARVPRECRAAIPQTHKVYSLYGQQLQKEIDLFLKRQDPFQVFASYDPKKAESKQTLKIGLSLKSILSAIGTLPQSDLILLGLQLGILEELRIAGEEDHHNITIALPPPADLVTTMSTTRSIDVVLMSCSAIGKEKHPQLAQQILSLNNSELQFNRHAHYAGKVRLPAEKGSLKLSGWKATGMLGEITMTDRGRNAIEELIAAEVLSLINEPAVRWKAKTEQPELSALINNFAKARYSLQTFLLVGFGSHLYSNSDLLAYENLAESLVPISGEMSLSSPGSLARLQELRSQLTLCGKNYVEGAIVSDDAYYGFGNLSESSSILEELKRLCQTQEATLR